MAKNVIRGKLKNYFIQKDYQKYYCIYFKIYSKNFLFQSQLTYNYFALNSKQYLRDNTLILHLFVCIAIIYHYRHH